MIKCAAIFLVVVLVSVDVNATQESYLPISSINVVAHYRLEPALIDGDYCDSIECDDTVYEGVVNLHIESDSKSGFLTNLNLTVGNDSVAFGDLSSYQNRRIFLNDVALVSSSQYLPKQLREQIIGLGSPRFYIQDIGFEDSECASGLRILNIAYDLETQSVELEAYCHDYEGDV